MKLIVLRPSSLKTKREMKEKGRYLKRTINKKICGLVQMERTSGMLDLHLGGHGDALCPSHRVRLHDQGGTLPSSWRTKHNILEP